MEENVNRKPAVKTIAVTAVITAVLVLAAGFAAVWYFWGDALKFKMEYPKLVELAGVIDSRYIGEYDPEDIAEAAAYEMVTATGDQWSYYISADEMKEYLMSVNNNYVGIGVTVSTSESGYITVEHVETDGGAWEAGIVAGDIITAVDGRVITDMTVSDVKNLISGEEGTMVEITVRRGETDAVLSVERRKISINPISYKLIGKTGYVKIANFFENTSENFMAAVDDLLNQGAESFVFDVRFNGGGYLHELLDMLDYLLPEGVIFRSEDIDGNTFEEKSDDNCVELPMAVLVNDMTFSAAEYFAEAIREFEWGTVVGGRTSGKGYSQNLIYLSDGSAVNLSTMKYYTPDGTCLAGVGITPDVEIVTEDEEYFGVYYGNLDTEDDSQLQAALGVVDKER